ncbi:hypothetical protein HDV05_007040, partial [Chytridiales sp. JEL 0842]
MKSTRHTASILQQNGGVFVLNVPVRGMEEVVLKVGGCSGRDVGDKIKHLELEEEVCGPGWREGRGGWPWTSAETATGMGGEEQVPKRKGKKKEVIQLPTCLALKPCVAHL